MLMPVFTVHSLKDLEAKHRALLDKVKGQVPLTTVEIRDFTFVSALLYVLAGAALDVVAQTASTPVARDLVCDAFIKNTAKKVAATLGLKMSK